ncbi:MAG: putative rane protein [Paenibacillus sp.]|nr:putative rane protein [Paenibacillus sp.]
MVQKEGTTLRIFAYELKKLWNWRVLTLIAALAVLVWFAFLSEALRSYDSLTTHGIYGSYQKEMFERYGGTLEPEELADYDIPGKKAAIFSEMDAIIANEAIFAENKIRNYAEFQAFADADYAGSMNEAEWKSFSEKVSQMRSKLSLSSDTQTLDEWYDSPLMRLQTLAALERTYVDYESSLRSYIDRDSRPVVVRAAEQILHMRNANLISYDLCRTFSLYAAVAGVFSAVAVILFVAPLLTTDRMHKINLIQYSSAIGRRILGIQLAATAVSAFVLSILLIVAAYAPFLLSGAGDYWNVPILSFTGFDMLLYNITFGQYAFILAGMILALSVGAGCFAFILARFSTNMVTMLIKTVPAGVAVAGIAVLSVNMALSYNNVVFSAIFRGRWDAPEILVCAFVAVVGMFAAAVVAMREKRVDVP